MFDIWGVEVNLLALVAAVVINMVVGMLWYSKFLFGETWKKLVDIDEASMKMGRKEIAGALLSALLMAVGLNSVIQFSYASSGLSLVPNALAAAFMMTFAILTPVFINMFLYEDKNPKLLILNAAQYFVSYILMGLAISWFVF